MSELTYDPSVFLCPNEAAAKGIILTPEAGLSTEERWERETAWLLPRLDFAGCELLIDYGCGIGRLATHLGPPVIGVDISPSMRAMAVEYVGRPDFIPMAPVMLEALVETGMRADGALAVWCLQHVLDIEETARLLANALSLGAPLYVVNRTHRCVPARDGERLGWAHDGKDVDALLLGAGFRCVASEAMPEALCEEGAHLKKWVRV